MMWLIFFLFNLVFAYEDPTGGKPFGPWVYNDQVKPMVKEAGRSENLIILAGSVAGTFAAMPFDHRVRDFRTEHGNLILGKQESHVVSDVANSWIQVGTSLLLLGIDSPEGVKLARTLIFTSITGSGLKLLANRERPDHSDHASWPSGHSSSMFALAGSLAGSYGWRAGIPAYSAATLVALSRIRENKHWLSDVVGGALFGTYWACVSNGVGEKSYALVPVPVRDGMMVMYSRPF
jgi:membrane-associated phospholipid phosphatase